MNATQYQVCIPTPISGDFRFCTRLCQYTTIKPDARPVVVHPSRHNPDHWSTSSEPNGIVPVVRRDQAMTFAAYVDTLEPWEIDVLRMTTMHGDPNAVCESLSHGLRAASDGSVRFLTQRAFGWVLSTDQGIQAATGMGPVQ